MGLSLTDDPIEIVIKFHGKSTKHTVRMPTATDLQEYERTKLKTSAKRGKVDWETHELKAALALYKKIIVSIEGFGDSIIKAGDALIDKVVEKYPLICKGVVDSFGEIEREDDEDLRQD